MITLTLHSCYYPFIKLFSSEYFDKNNEKYYKGFFQDAEFKKSRFIVREDFFNFWSNYGIYQISLKLTEKGATLISYLSFKDVKSRQKIKFIEITGIYITGIFQINQEILGKNLFCFIPSIPNRFALSEREHHETKYAFQPDFKYHLKSITMKDVVLAYGLDIYGNTSREDLLSLADSTDFYIVISKKDYSLEKFYENDEYLMEEIEQEENVEINSFELVFSSLEDFVSNINKANNLSLQPNAELFNPISNHLLTMEKEITFMKQVKDVTQYQTGKKNKLELRTNTIDLVNKELYLLISKIGGTKYNCNYLQYGIELPNNECINMGEYYGTGNSKQSFIYLDIILQV